MKKNRLDIVKIKRKVEMTQDEYAKHIIDKYGVSHCKSELFHDNSIDVPLKFNQMFEINPILKKDLPIEAVKNGKFIVEIEEEVTEDSEICNLVEIYSYVPESTNVSITNNQSITELKDDGGCNTKAFYILNDDLTMTLIWTKEKGLVA